MFPNREGQRVPQATFRVRSENGEWQTLTTDALFKDKTVVVFSLPGAFTPTCSSMHVPRYNELAPAFYANGVERIVCISVNDAFVMDEWARVQECGNVLMLPDGNGEFTAKMGMLVDKTPDADVVADPLTGGVQFDVSSGPPPPFVVGGGASTVTVVVSCSAARWAAR